MAAISGKEEAAVRAAYLDDLNGREEEVWRQVEIFIETKLPKNYDEAVRMIDDLREIAARKDATKAFEERLNLLLVKHAKKVSFLDRLNQVGMLRS